MILGKVIGNIVSTRKEESLMGYKLLIVEPLEEYNNNKNLVAIDRVGAGIQSIVIVSTGSSARVGLHKDNVPIDATIIGIVDE
ncbi:EutN/CcmL family microcompartment protein [Clostridium chauvoei]|uniref:EutN/CcmL family microcompartment protein n=2 Tax=Clostridium chauvoei TaxID=46867 RepID=A0ABD4RE25_9CLOT|nr:EutN/CcmL family microcompartment protein [Clostridium chauvoei]ATD55057.1 ethanolamine utilization protein EutN [Clostridium chauvoei]ATD57269.1 ethanolamine utilization protein EutN [Clostridium chauvoei]MBX7279400.1 EutN/CcmL family microcompartment protein [Clostridium chauvoei]MBX7282514.1 EutN/CcmL family microcompartment protein [Clostridium chauvoei]MBX7285598.1 EutN/CcmL family microcompartment protein [Clostridium chauvoei]